MADFYAKAESQLKSTGGWFSLGSKTEKFEKAVELFKRAANAYRAQDQLDKAAEAYERAAVIEETSLGMPTDAVGSRLEAAKSYRVNNPLEAARCYKDLVHYYTSSGDPSGFRRAAGYQHTLGEIYEQCADKVDDESRGSQLAQRGQGNDGHFPPHVNPEKREQMVRYRKQAVDAFLQASKWLHQDGAESLATKSKLKAADNCALAEDYVEAIKLYLELMETSSESNLMKWNVIRYGVQAYICGIALRDSVVTGRVTEMLKTLDRGFIQSREARTLPALEDAYKSGEEDLFRELLMEYESIKPLDPISQKVVMKFQFEDKMDDGDDLA